MISCIAIDDEPFALQQISNYIEKTPFLKLEASFGSAINANNYLMNNTVDLLFLDINMPDLSGMELVKTLANPPKVIFTTAYSEYALEGFRVNALDYLLKPIGYPDFLKAANKAQQFIGNIEKTSKEADKEFLFVKSEYRIIRISLPDIKYIEGMREYVRIHLENQKPILSLVSMAKLEEQLPAHSFMRVHRSYLVNLTKITSVERNRIIFDQNCYIPVSEHYKARFQEFIQKNFLL